MDQKKTLSLGIQISKDIKPEILRAIFAQRNDLRAQELVLCFKPEAGDIGKIFEAIDFAEEIVLDAGQHQGSFDFENSLSKARTLKIINSKSDSIEQYLRPFSNISKLVVYEPQQYNFASQNFSVLTQLEELEFEFDFKN